MAFLFIAVYYFSLYVTVGLPVRSETHVRSCSHCVNEAARGMYEFNCSQIPPAQSLNKTWCPSGFKPE